MVITLRDIRKEDHAFVLRLNEENVEMLSPMDQKKLEFYTRISDMFKIVEVDGERAGFLIAIRDGADYPNENFDYFSSNYPHFLYVDRIVIDTAYRKHGLGGRLYDAVKHRARAEGIRIVTAEIDIEPVRNTASIRFHESMGFRETDVQWVRNHTVKVSLVICEL